MITDTAGPDAAGGRAAFDGDFDVCVVGTGPAGITVARRLAARGARVALMEAGGFAFDEGSQDIYAGPNLGLAYFGLDWTRLRFFGGTSNHWGGWSRPLDPIDFEPRPGIPLSGWPISARDLDPYRAETDAILDLDPANLFPDLPFADPSYSFVKTQMRFSRPPTRFGEKFRDELAASERILTGLGANLVDIRLDDDRRRVVSLGFRSLDPGDPGFRVRAARVVLALGGIENARALLLADGQVAGGIGNQYDLVGRFFSEHPHVVVAEVLYQRDDLTNADRRGLFSPTPAWLIANEVLNFNLRMNPILAPAREAPGGPLCVMPFLDRLAVAVFDRPPACTAPPRVDSNEGTILITPEQALNPDSRVRLVAERDALGQRRAGLDWQLTALDYETMRQAVFGFGGVLAAQGFARLRLRDWLMADAPQLDPADATAGHHHMCTTRMSADPRTGVVDANCRVHGIDNLYMAGSSSFATGGWANPTYTIVQLALRLGDHLADLSVGQRG